VRLSRPPPVRLGAAAHWRCRLRHCLRRHRLLDFTGPLQTWLREGWGLTGLPEIRSRGGVILVMSLALYPYVYLIAKTPSRRKGDRLEAAQSLGLSRTHGFFRVALRWRAVDRRRLMLALMETLAISAPWQSSTTTPSPRHLQGVYSLFSLAAAAQLARS